MKRKTSSLNQSVLLVLRIFKILLKNNFWNIIVSKRSSEAKGPRYNKREIKMKYRDTVIHLHFFHTALWNCGKFLCFHEKPNFIFIICYTFAIITFILNI